MPTAMSPRAANITMTKEDPASNVASRRNAESQDNDSRPVTPMSRSSRASRTSLSSPSINLVEDDDDDDDEDDKINNNNNDDDDDENADIQASDEENVHERIKGELEDADDEKTAVVTKESTNGNTELPRLRLNMMLASDPALQPYARDIMQNSTASADDRSASSMVIDIRTPNDDPSQAKKIVRDETTAEAPSPPTPPLSSPPATILKPQSNGTSAFTCEPCGIKFSSLSTLEAHQTYYCSHMRKECLPDAPITHQATTAAHHAQQRKSNRSGEPPNGGQWGDLTAAVPTKPTMQQARSIGRMYACPHCSYSADKKVSLNRHMRMHQSSPQPAAAVVPLTSSSSAPQTVATAAAAAATTTTMSSGTAVADLETAGCVTLPAMADCYCSDCDIRFTSLKTYRAHKQHYCSARHREGSASKLPNTEASNNNITNRSQSPLEQNHSPILLGPHHQSQVHQNQQPPQPYLALPTNPIVIIPYSLIRGASILPGPMSSISPLNVPNPEHTCFILTNGIMHPIAHSLALPPSLMSPPPAGANGTGNAVNSSTPPLHSVLQPDAGTQLPRPKSAVSVGSSMSARRTPSASDCESVYAADETKSLSGASQTSVPTNLISPNTTNTGTTPLDLSVRCHPADLSTRSSASVERIICVPSLTASPIQAANPPVSPVRRVAAQLSLLSPQNAILSGGASHPSFALYGANTNSPYMLRQLMPADMMSQLMEINSGTATTTTTTATTPTDNQRIAVAAASGPSNGRRSSVARSRRSATAPQVQQSIGNNSNNTNNINNNGAQIIVKQGVSKCKECNIVFCKYENYLAHKKHYCSARHQQPTQSLLLLPQLLEDCATSSETTNELSAIVVPPSAPSPPPRHGKSGTPNPQHPSGLYQQVICAACGIKFTSLDNLSAHQMYYCPKRNEALLLQQQQQHSNAAAAMVHPTTTPASATSSSGKLPLLPTEPQSKRSSSQHTHQQFGSSSHQHHHHHHQYKCPLCDVVSASAGDAKRHLDTHAGVKAFRCTICRYRGNTMRGMRTHIRMHFDRKTASADFNEEDYIACVLEENGVEVMHGGAGGAALRAISMTANGLTMATSSAGQILHACDECSFVSSFKGNVIRHTKLVHAAQADVASIPLNTSVSIGEGGESLLLNPDGTNTILNTSAYSVNFKAERMLEHQQQQQQLQLLQQQHQQQQHSNRGGDDSCSDDSSATPATKRIKLETLDDDATTTSSVSSASSPVPSSTTFITSTAAYYKTSIQPAIRDPQPPPPLPPPPQQQQSPSSLQQQQRRKSTVLSVN